MFKKDDQVETPLGVGKISEVREMTGGTVYLVEIMPGGFGRGYSEVFSANEIELFESLTMTESTNDDNKTVS